jgi:DNA-binding response OmpR family regulator
MANDCLVLSGDLMLASHVTGAAARVACAAQTTASVETLLASLDGQSCRVVVIDLTTPGLAIADLVAKLRALDKPPAQIIAFGPHVQEIRLTDAANAGCDQVLTRGQFYSRMDELLSEANG